MMETRVLIPNSLKIVISNPCKSTLQLTPSSDPEEPTSSSTNDIFDNFDKPRKERRVLSSGSEEGEETEVAVTSSEEDNEDEGESEIGSSFTPTRADIKRRKNKWVECGVSVCARERLDKGVRFGSNEGDIQILHLDKHQLAPLHSHDIRLVFGCVDRVVSSGGEEGEESASIRVCNWLRFLTPVEEDENKKEANIVGRFVEGLVDFQIIKQVQEGEELVANFDIQSLARLHTNSKLLLGKKSGIDGPLDLSKSLHLSPPLLSHQQPLNIPNFPINSPHPLLLPQSSNTASSQSSSSNSERRKPLSLFSISSVLQGKHEQSGRSISTITTPPPNHQSFLRPMPILRTRGRERSLLPCEVCGKAFDRPSLLKRHMRTHTGEKPHICDVCSKGFSTSSSLNTHRRIHSGEKPHQCPVCGKRFTASSNLYYHRMTHNKEKPHKCLLCGKSFPTPGDLKSHQYVHSGSWPYNCPICHRGFSKQTNLRNHLLLHSGDKPHNCHLCGKKFALACNLRAHIRSHTHQAEQPISTCLSCKRSFISSLNMLVNGHCRTCLLTLKEEEQSKGGDSPPPNTTSSPGPHPQQHIKLKHSPTPAFILGGSGGGYPLTMSGGVTGTTGLMGGLGLPLGLGSPWGGGRSSALEQMQSGAGMVASPSTTNPFLEQLFQWNYRFAKETAGNLNMMQQKLLESQMLAAHLMIGSSPSASSSREQMGVPLGLSELIRASVGGGRQLHHPPGEFLSLDLNKFIQQ